MEKIIHICTQLDKLREFHVGYTGVLNTSDVLQILNVGTKLQWFYPRCKIDFDANTHEKLKSVIEKRGENSQFILKVYEADRMWYLPQYNRARGPESDLNLSSEWYPQIGIKLEELGCHHFREWELVVCAHTNIGTGRCSRQHKDLTEFPVRYKNKDICEKVEKFRRVSGGPPLDQSLHEPNLGSFTL